MLTPGARLNGGRRSSSGGWPSRYPITRFMSALESIRIAAECAPAAELPPLPALPAPSDVSPATGVLAGAAASLDVPPDAGAAVPGSAIPDACTGSAACTARAARRAMSCLTSASWKRARPGCRTSPASTTAGCNSASLASAASSRDTPEPRRGRAPASASATSANDSLLAGG
eukprot:351612-Chlamydomonas_euryale.AAC.13